MSVNYKKLGEIVELIDERNKSLESSDVLGISIDKEFMPSVANTIGTDLSNYKLLRMNTFACNPMHVGRDERLPVSLYKKDIPAIVSPAYFMFRVKDENKVLPDFFDKADIVFLRNVFIYFDNNLRKEILEKAAEKLIPGPDMTFHAYNPKHPRRAHLPIDYIFVNNAVKVHSFQVIDDEKNGLHTSDHYPLKAAVSL